MDISRHSATAADEGNQQQQATTSKPGRKTAPTREQAQLGKLKEANAKYKNLLKLAKERIQEQEGLLDERRSELVVLISVPISSSYLSRYCVLAHSRSCRSNDRTLAEAKQLKAELSEANEHIEKLKTNAQGGGSGGAGSGQANVIDPNETTILRVCQRIREEIDTDGDADDAIGDVPMEDSDDSYEIWALIEYETINEADNNPLNTTSYRRNKRWRKFVNESELSDYIRRDTGEPLTLPPYSLSPEQSRRMEADARKAVSAISEEFRRFRVRAEVAKKQADATVRALHTNSVQTTRMRIEGQDIESELAQAKTDHAQLTALRAEMSEQESRWKESYDLLLAENEKLKSSGAEALLAAQWRHRYESCLKEKEAALTNLEMEKEKVVEMQDTRSKADAGKYEAKYRDLKVRCMVSKISTFARTDCLLINFPGVVQTVSEEGEGDLSCAAAGRDGFHADIARQRRRVGENIIFEELDGELPRIRCGRSGAHGAGHRNCSELH